MGATETVAEVGDGGSRLLAALSESGGGGMLRSLLLRARNGLVSAPIAQW